LAAGTENPASAMPSGSNTRLLSTSSSGAPATRSTKMPATVAPVLYRHASPGSDDRPGRNSSAEHQMVLVMLMMSKMWMV
jgi:hypothetical protein